MRTEDAIFYGYKEIQNVSENECPYSGNCGTCKNFVETEDSKHEFACFCTAVKQKQRLREAL